MSKLPFGLQCCCPPCAAIPLGNYEDGNVDSSRLVIIFIWGLEFCQVKAEPQDIICRELSEQSWLYHVLNQSVNFTKR